jgi:hypothetical protein
LLVLWQVFVRALARHAELVWNKTIDRQQAAGPVQVS